nr:hypothetical protein [Tanacetum cinerariifolium]
MPLKQQKNPSDTMDPDERFHVDKGGCQSYHDNVMDQQLSLLYPHPVWISSPLEYPLELIPSFDSILRAFASLGNDLGGNLLERSTQHVLTIIENKSKVRNSQSKSIASQVKACDTNSNSEIAKLTHVVNEQTSAMTIAMAAMLKQFQAPVKAIVETCVTCEGAH